MDAILNEKNFSNDFIGNRNRLMIEFLYFTGVRVSEIINLKIVNLDFDDKSMKIVGKGKKERFLPITDNFCNKIKSYVNEFNITDHLFTNEKNEKLYQKKIYRIVKKHLSIISTKTNNSPHIIRHTFATHMLNNGADINAIKELLGHNSLNATQVYTHNLIEKIKMVHKKAHPRA